MYNEQILWIFENRRSQHCTYFTLAPHEDIYTALIAKR